MGAYPESYKEYFNFNIGTGDLIIAKDLFTVEGITEIRKLLLKERKKRIVEWVNEMDTMYNNRDDSAWINETFEECNEEAGEDDFIIKRDGIVFWKKYCFSHAARPYDTDLDVVFSYKELMRLLSDEGKKLLQ